MSCQRKLCLQEPPLVSLEVPTLFVSTKQDPHAGSLLEVRSRMRRAPDVRLELLEVGAAINMGQSQWCLHGILALVYTVADILCRQEPAAQTARAAGLIPYPC